MLFRSMSIQLLPNRYLRLNPIQIRFCIRQDRLLRQRHISIDDAANYPISSFTPNRLSRLQLLLQLLRYPIEVSIECSVNVRPSRRTLCKLVNSATVRFVLLFCLRVNETLFEEIEGSAVRSRWHDVSDFALEHWKG